MEELVPTPPSFFLIHGFSLWSAWCIFGMIQIMSNRYFKHHWRYNMWIHRISGSVILLTTLIYASYALYKFDRFEAFHVELGIYTLVGVSVPVFSGILARSRLTRADSNSKCLRNCKNAHKVFGYLILILGNTTVTFGIYDYTT